MLERKTSEEREKHRKDEVGKLMEVAFPNETEPLDSRRTIKVHTEEAPKTSGFEPPPDRKPLYPKVYDFWEDEDEEGNDDLDEAAIRHRQKMKRVKDGEEELGEEDEEAYILRSMFSQKTRKQRRAECDARYAAFFAKEKADREREAEMQDLEDLKFPNKWGWFYTDGYYDFDETFGIDEKHFKEHTNNEQAFIKKFRRCEKETFTSKFKRHFWPPKTCKLFWICSCFRTRGSYLDLPEIVNGNQKLSPFGFQGIDVDFEHHGPEMMPADENEDEPEPDPEFVDLEAGDAHGVTAPTVKKKAAAVSSIMAELGPANLNVGWEDYYYDDYKGEFYRKPPGLGIRYYFDANNTCWRRKRDKKKRINYLTPYDYYWSAENGGEFYPRNEFAGEHKEDIAYDPEYNCWRFEPQESTHQRVLRGQFLVRTQLKKTVGNDNPDAFYWDEEDTTWKKKANLKEDESIEWDGNGMRFIKRFEGNDWTHWRGHTGYSPDDFYYSEPDGKFQIRPKRQPEKFFYSHMEGIWRTKKKPVKISKRKMSPTDYYFEHGMFKEKIPNQDHLYKQMKFALIYKHREEPLSKLYCEDFYFDYDKRLWLPRQVRYPLLKMKKEEVPWEEGREKMKEVKVDSKEDFYFDIEDGVFLRKTDKEEYFLDEEEGVFKSVEQREKYRLHILPNDFYWTGKEFQRKDPKSTDEAYKYDMKWGCYRLSKAPKSDDQPNHYFDFAAEKWKPKPSGGDKDVTHEPNSQDVKRDENRNPEDFYFNSKLGVFMLRSENMRYTFIANEGIYKEQGTEIGPTLSGLDSRDFYWDDLERRWKRKLEGHGNEYFWDKNNRINRHIISVQPRSGLWASDYYWNEHLGRYLPIIDYDRNRGKIVDEDSNWDPLRQYDKPWLLAAPLRYSSRPNDAKKKMKKKKKKDPETAQNEANMSLDDNINRRYEEDR